MHRFIVSVTAAALLCIANSSTALAGPQWCVIDPILVIDGHVSDVQVVFDQTYTSTVTGISFTFHVPADARASVISPPAVLPYTVELLYDLPAASSKKTTVTVDSLVTATSHFRVDTVVLTTGTVLTAKGKTGSTTSIRYSTSR